MLEGIGHDLPSKDKKRLPSSDQTNDGADETYQRGHSRRELKEARRLETISRCLRNKPDGLQNPYRQPKQHSDATSEPLQRIEERLCVKSDSFPDSPLVPKQCVLQERMVLRWEVASGKNIIGETLANLHEHVRHHDIVVHNVVCEWRTERNKPFASQLPLHPTRAQSQPLICVSTRRLHQLRQPLTELEHKKKCRSMPRSRDSQVNESQEKKDSNCNSNPIQSRQS
jgi:hypothetical protein